MKATRLIFCLIIFTLLLSGLSSAEIPKLISYQGKLTDSSGKPVSDGTYTITFRIYEQESGGSPLWYETQTITVQKGIFSTQIGATKDLNLAFDKPYFLGIQVGTDTEMSPRQALSSSAYAFRAKTADKITIPFYISGLNLQYIDSKNIQISPGVVDIAGVLLKTPSYSPQLNITDDINWIGSKGTINNWIYVYVYNNSNTIEYKLSNRSPNLADEDSNTAGTKRYIIDGSAYYRCIGAIKTDTSGNILKFWCKGNQYLYDAPQRITTTPSNNQWSLVDISPFMPAISERGLFGVGGHNSPGFGNPVAVWLRPYGAIWSTDDAAGLRKRTCNYQNGLSGNEGIYAQMGMFTDNSRRIEYRTDGFNVFEIKILGYWVDIS